MICEALADGEFEIIETFLLAKNGRKIPVTLKGSTYITESGRVLHMFIASDKSDFYKMMARMREVQDQLTHSARLASLGEMAAGIGHELTQPLNAILLLTRNCLKAMQDPQKNQQDARREPQHHHRSGKQGLKHHQQPEEFCQQGQGHHGPGQYQLYPP